MSHSYYETVKNIDAKNIEVYTKPFWSAYIKNLKLTKLRFGDFFEELSWGFPVKEAWNLAIIV